MNDLGSWRRSAQRLLLAVAVCASAREAQPAVAASKEAARGAGLQERIAAARAIEAVRWEARIWPEQNTSPKPTIDQALPAELLKRRVEDGLRKESALRSYWSREIRPEELEAELDRIVAQTKNPGQLARIFGALHDDRSLILESLVRPLVVDRVIRSCYGDDEHFHGALRIRAELALHGAVTQRGLMAAGARRTITTVELEQGTQGEVQGDAPGAAPRATPLAMSAGAAFPVETLGREAWERLGRRAGAAWNFATEGVDLPLSPGLVGRLHATPNGFEADEVYRDGPDRLIVTSFNWPKRPFDEWWESVRESVPAEVPAVPATSARPMPQLPASCAADSWSVMQQWSRPTARRKHLAVWTGTEMIVWGGEEGVGGGNSLFTGGRYDPATDTWKATNAAALVPHHRIEFSMIWTGTEVIVWGGQDLEGLFHIFNDGGRYNPVTDTWTPTSLGANVPTPRFGHTAIWTGTEMIVWGGYENVGNPFNTGGRYNPATDSWVPTSTGATCPLGRLSHTAVWTNGKMIVWGGWSSTTGVMNTGGAYLPASDTWTAVSLTGAPTARDWHTAVWTNGKMIVWGGVASNGGVLNSGGVYSPISNTWTSTRVDATTPIVRALHSAVWTGSEMIVWGGFNNSSIAWNTGGRYNPTTNTWTPTSLTGAVPTARRSHTAVWTGSEMLVWGGADGAAVPLDSGARYSPSTDTWTPTGYNPNVPTGSFARRVWTGSEMIVWGYSSLNAGYRYDPALDNWTTTSVSAATPSGRYFNGAVWTGKEMIVWGGLGSGNLNTGGRYDPVTDQWSATSTGPGVPPGMSNAEIRWTGEEALFWGGVSNGNYATFGGRYVPSTDTWRTMTIDANAPSAREGYSSVWTGMDLIVWGGHFFQSGSGTTYFNTGASYDPKTDSWQPTSTGSGSPTPASRHGAAWTGQEMLIWSGIPWFPAKSGVAKYDPLGDTWTTAPPDANEPPQRDVVPEAWTGREMIVWGGWSNPFFSIAGGGRFDAVSGSWLPMNPGEFTVGPRDGLFLVWTGDSLIVWGGEYSRSMEGEILTTGAVWCSGQCVTPASTPGIQVAVGSGGGAVLSWPTVPDAYRYDVVRGGLQSLGASAGDFSTATQSCLASRSPAAGHFDGTAPAAGDGFWYLVRAVGCGPGSYDDGSQVGSRDPEISASPNNCP